MGLTLERVEALLLVAVIVAVVARRLRLPYTVGLLLTGLGIASLGVGRVEMTKELIFGAFLPPLIFEAAIQIPVDELKRDFPVTGLLATLGVLVAAGLTAAGVHFILGWPWISGLVAGALLAATDPVSVIATFKENGAHGRLRMLVETESLLNDGTAAVLFTMLLTIAAGGAASAPSVVWSFVAITLGGTAIGAAVAGIALFLVGRTEDHLVELTITTVVAYASFWIAERFHLSGVLATLASGVVVGNYGSCGAFTDRGREAVVRFWEFAAFIANSLVFLLIGQSLHTVSFGKLWPICLVVLALVLLGRAVAVYGCAALLGRSRWKIEPRHQLILFWGGLRGALALALAFGLPADLPQRDAIRTAAYAVVAFSILIQGLTITPLLKAQSDG